MMALQLPSLGSMRASLLALPLAACLDTELPQRHLASNTVEERGYDPTSSSPAAAFAGGPSASDGAGGRSTQTSAPNVFVPPEPAPDAMVSDDGVDPCEGADRAEQAIRLEILAAVNCRRAYVDDEDWFRFELERSSVFVYGATADSGVTSNLYVEAPLYRPEEALDHATWNASSTPRQLPLERGAYLLQVSGSGLYNLQLSAEGYGTPEPADDPGDEPESALAVDFSQGQARIGGYVGVTDTYDFYAFTLDDDAALLAAFADLQGTVTGSVLRRGDPLGQSEGSVPGSGSTPSETRIPLAAGEHLFRVATDYRANALYTLTLKQEPNP
jgi:hypothetical protein